MNDPNSEVRLNGSNAQEAINAQTISKSLKTKYIGRSMKCLEFISSTNDAAKEWASQGAPNGALITAEHQTAGRGKYDRKWLSEPYQNIAFSLVLRPEVEPRLSPRITIAASVAVQRTLTSIIDSKIEIKWPNDILCDNSKICGTLTELCACGNRIEHAILGIGVNVNQLQFDPQISNVATSIAVVRKAQFDRSHLLATLLNELEIALDAAFSSDFVRLLTEYKRNCCSIGKNVVLRKSGSTTEGFVHDVDDSGALIVETTSGEYIRVSSAEYD